MAYTADQARVDMLEKLGWAQRSLDRMKQTPKDDPVATQDHFWSYLHAAQLVWFYFGRWVKEAGRTGPKGLLDQWKQRALSPKQAEIWKTLNELRDVDAHVKPVQGTSHLMRSRSGRLRSPLGVRMAKTQRRYVVEHADKWLDVFDLCDQGVEVLQAFVADFHTI
jgi:hypothetical protein